MSLLLLKDHVFVVNTNQFGCLSCGETAVPSISWFQNHSGAKLTRAQVEFLGLSSKKTRA